MNFVVPVSATRFLRRSVEDDNGGYAVTKTYAYDSMGNPVEESLSLWNGAARRVGYRWEADHVLAQLLGVAR